MNWDAIGSMATLVGTILALIAGFSAYFEFKKSTDISKADFILSLQQAYADNESYSELFNECWNYYLEEQNKADLEVYLEGKGKELLNYMTFFESVYIMLERRVLDIMLLDELFGRRFFIVVNNKVVQEFDLVKNYEYYKNVYYLYYYWQRYRGEQGEFFLGKSDNKEGKQNRYEDLFEALKRKRRDEFDDLVNDIKKKERGKLRYHEEIK